MSLFESVAKLRTNARLRLYFDLYEGLSKVTKKAKILKNAGCGTALTSLIGFGGGYKGWVL